MPSDETILGRLVQLSSVYLGSINTSSYEPVILGGIDACTECYTAPHNG